MPTEVIQPVDTQVSGEASTKEWLASIEGKVIAAYDFTVVRPTSLLSAAPLSAAQIELGQRIARKYGLTE